MAPTRNDVIKVCEVLAEEQNLRVTVTESAKGALVTGAGAFAGGLLAGPLGLALGGSLAACWTALRSRNNYRSAVEVIGNLPDDQKERLANSVIRLLQSIEAQDVVAIITILATNASLKELVVKEMITFISNELRLSIVQ